MKELTPICPYCKQFSNKVTGADIHPHRPDLSALVIYHCRPCGAYVGTHKGTDKPLGRLANAELRKAKMRAHSAFDPIWREGNKSRKGAYKWLAKQLGIDGSECHIGMFDVDMCNRVVELCNGR